MTTPAPAAPESYAWVKYRHPEYAEKIELWRFIRAHYRADVVRPTRVKDYLIQKKRGETDAAFDERTRCADYTNHFAAIVDGLVGMLAMVEENANRHWGPTSADGKIGGLGDPKGERTPAARLWRNVDGRRGAYLSLWHKVAIELGLMHATWILADSLTGVGAVLRNLEVESVTNWLPTPDGGYAEAMLCERVDTRTTLQGQPTLRERYLHLQLTDAGKTAWTRYLVEDGKVVPESGPGRSGVFEVAFKTDEGRPTIPLFRADLPLDREVGYYLAKKQNALFNRESERDHLVRVANFPKFLHPQEASSDSFKEVEKAFQAGSNLIHSSGKYDAPPTTSGQLATEILEKKSREYYMTAAREYGDAAKERTATELRQNAAAGPHAFLALLSRQLDAAETAALHFAEQIEFPGKAAQHFVAKVERSTNFLPADPDALVDRLIGRVFGKDVPVPLGKTAQLAAAKQVAEYMGLDVNAKELEAAVEAHGLLAASATAPTLPFPAQVRVHMVLKVLAALSAIDPTATIPGADGNELNLLQVLTDKAEQLAESQDLAQQRESQVFGGPIPPPPGRAGPQGAQG